MFTQQFIDPDIKETPHDVAIHNLIEADKYLDLTSFSMAVAGYMNAHPDYDYQDIEKVCRNLNLNTHLFAKKDTDFQLQHPDMKIECKYQITYSCRKYKDSLAEVLQHWPSYEKNFEALKITGHIIIKDNSQDITDQMDDIKLLDPGSPQQLMCSNKKKLVMSVINTVSELSDYLTCTLGKKPEPMVVGMHNTRAPIFAFCIDGKIVSEYGYVQHRDGAKIIKIKFF